MGLKKERKTRKESEKEGQKKTEKKIRGKIGLRVYCDLVKETFLFNYTSENFRDRKNLQKVEIMKSNEIQLHNGEIKDSQFGRFISQFCNY